MKKSILPFIFCSFLFQNLDAQIHLKTGIHYSIPTGFAQSIEYAYNPRIGLEVLVAGNYLSKSFSGSAAAINGRFYLNPKKEIDGRYFGFYVHPFLRINRNINTPTFGPTNVINISKRTSGLGIGIMYGRKMFIYKKTFFEFNFGMGKSWSREVFDRIDLSRTSSPPIYDIMINLLFAYKI